MSLWWTKKNQLDEDQIKLIEDLNLDESHLVTGPPGCGKTNVLLRRAQYARSQEISNIVVLSFTRPLTEFIKTGCLDGQGREIFPPGLIQTVESWIRSIYRAHSTRPPQSNGDYLSTKRSTASNALAFIDEGVMNRYDAIFVDEAQDLLAEEIELITQWGKTVFYVGDNRQQIYDGTAGLNSIRKIIPAQNIHSLKFHYRLAPKICSVADKILAATGASSLSNTCHYKGPSPESISMSGNLSVEQQLEMCAQKLSGELRVYQDLIRQGDRLGIVVHRKVQRDQVYSYLESIPALEGRSQIVRAREEDERGSSEISDDAQIYILTLKGCKGLEFRSLHWLFADDCSHYHEREMYYTAVTRAKTDLNVSATGSLPAILLQAHAQPAAPEW